MQRTPIPLLIINSHPIQYFAPLYRELAADPAFDLTVLYCSKHGLSGEIDAQFGTSVQWDIPLLNGYRHEFLANQSPKPSIYGFWGLLNLSVIGRLWRAPRSVVIVYGWASAVCVLAILVARLAGHTVCMRADSAHSNEQSRPPRQLQVRRWVLGRGLFRCIHYFLYIGQQNKAFYQFYGATDPTLIYCPFAVDNARFQQQAQALRPRLSELRRQLNIPVNQFVVLFSGKYLPKKRPLDLLQAVHRLGRANVTVVLVGEGELREVLATFARQHALPHVLLTGFVNQSAIGQYYALADAYVMCSISEPWGLSTNEAMNFELPVILSDAIGCAVDLVHEGVNGYSYSCGNVPELADRLERVMALSPAQRQKMGNASLGLISHYSYAQTVQSLKAALCPTHP